MPYGVGFDNIALQLKLNFSDIVVSFRTFNFGVEYCRFCFVDQQVLLLKRETFKIRRRFQISRQNSVPET